MKGVLLNSLRLFVALMMMGTFFVSFATMGMVGAYKSLEYTKIVQCHDGKDEVYITLRLGPFSYRIVVPEEKK